MAIPQPFGLTTSGTTLGDNFNTLFTSSSINNISNIATGAIFEFLWKVPTTGLAQYLATEATSVTPSNVSLITTIAKSPNMSFQAPSMSVSAQYSTFIYTKDVSITISAAAEQASVQIWYSS